MNKKNEGITALLPCQQALLASREEIRGMGVYRCPKAVFVLSGPEDGLLELVCEECIKKAPPGIDNQTGPPRQETHTSGARIG